MAALAYVRVGLCDSGISSISFCSQEYFFISNFNVHMFS